jgi:probable rRNA maturation factor
MEINILVEEDLKIATDIDWLQRIVEKTLEAEKAPFLSELGLVITVQERVRELNRDYRGKDSNTDVLSFSMSEKKKEDDEPFVGPPDGLLHLGEVVISYPQALLQAREQGHPIKREMATLIVHGVLHLLGYDHEKPEMEPAMTSREGQILNSLRTEIN